MSGTVRIALLVKEHPPERYSPLMPEVTERLRAAGARVDVVDPDQGWLPVSDASPAHDLYVLKSGTETALSAAAVLESRGARVLNTARASARARDKAELYAVLHQAGLPVPETWLTVRPRVLAPLLAGGPLVVKPSRGSQGRGVRVVRHEDHLASEPESSPEPLIVQRYHQPSGRDRKVYVIGHEVFGVSRVFPAATYAEKVGRPWEVPAEVAAMARAAQTATGLRLFGFDVVESDGRRWVVDLSSFPGFKGVPAAARRIADLVLDVAHERRPSVLELA